MGRHRAARLGTALLAAAAAVLGTGCDGGGAGGAGQPVVGVSLLNLSNEFIVMLNGAMEEKARELGVRLVVDAQRSAARQIRQVETFLAQRVDAIILNPCEVEASSPAVEKAVAAGVPIVNVNSLTRAAPTAFVGSRDEESGRLAMEHIAARLGGPGGGVVMMHGFMGQAAQIQRDRGAREVLARHPELRLLADQTAEWSRAKAVTLMENWIQAHGPAIRAVFAQNDEMAMGALLALERAKRKEQVVVVGVDAIADALQAVKAGRLDATVFQDAKGQGRGAVEAAVKILRKQPCEKEVFIPFQVVTRVNVDRFLK